VDQALDAVDHLDRETGVEQHLAHEDEQRDRVSAKLVTDCTLLRTSCTSPGSPPR